MMKHSKTRKFPFGSEAARKTPDFSAPTGDAPFLELDLTDHFLIAMPSMLDPVFGGAVIYLCEHNADGALGVIVNKQTDMMMDVLLDRIDLQLRITSVREQIGQIPIMFGGPVQIERGFVLHTPGAEFSSTMKVTDEVALTTSKDVLEAVAEGTGPQRMLVTLGCAGWSAGQLEQEIGRNGWLTVRADPKLIFDTPIEERFSAAMKLLGIDPAMLAGQAGHA